MDWSGDGSVNAAEDDDLTNLSNSTTNEHADKLWSKLKSKYEMGDLIHMPGVMHFLHKCTNGDLWPESILCEIVSNGASGPYVAAMLDRAYEKSSTKVLLSVLNSSSPSLPERALVWALEASIKNNNDQGSLDNLLKRQFSHNHLVGALRGLDSTVVIALLDFLINKTRNASFSDNLSIIDLTAWIGAVIDAHPTTINSDGNEDYLNEALQVVNEKLELLAEFDTIDKLLAKNRLRSEQRSGGKYSVEILKL